MHIVPWCPVLHQDFQVLTNSHNITPATELPAIGFIAYQNETPIAIGFLRMVEGGYAQLDSLITHADFDSEVRHEALNLLVNTLIQKARDLKLLGLIAHTQDAGILARAEKLGFQISTQTIIGLRLA